MIAIPRALARSFRSALRRCLAGPGTRPQPPLVLARCDGQSLALQAAGPDVAVRHCSPSGGPAGALAFRADVLARFEGRTDAPAALEEVSPGRARATWSEGGVPQAVEFHTADPATTPDLPEVPARLTAMPESFLAALGEACRTTARESTRFGVTRVQMRGKGGQLVATDGRQLLVQGGFRLPWPDSVLVPRLPLLDLPGVSLAGPVGLARAEDYVFLRAGAWTFWLRVDGQARFPDVDDAIPRERASSRLRLDAEDAAFLVATLPRLPGRDDDYSPVTLDLGMPPAVRAKGAGGGPATEAVLARSSTSGPPVRLATDRRYLVRAAQLGFDEIQVVRPEVPLVARHEARIYVWMPLDANAAIPPGKDVLRLVSSEPLAAPAAPHPSERRRTAMPAPPSNGHHRPDERPSPGAPERPSGIEDLIAEAEALRNLLGEGASRAARLVAALKQHRRHAKAVRDAVVSLRQLNLGG